VPSSPAPTPTPSPAAADPSARLAAIYREHFAFVWRSLRRLGVPEEAVDDACQDVFLVVARRLDDFEGRSTLRTWLFGIAVRVSRARWRTNGRRRRREAAAAEAGAAEVERPHERCEARITLHRLLFQLSEPLREVYILMELEGMTAPEVAAGLGLNVNTVYTRLRAARRDLERLAAAITAPKESR